MRPWGLRLGRGEPPLEGSNVNVGIATITITGKGNYTGTLKRTFEIKKDPKEDDKKIIDYVTFEDIDQIYILHEVNRVTEGRLLKEAIEEKLRREKNEN